MFAFEIIPMLADFGITGAIIAGIAVAAVGAGLASLQQPKFGSNDLSGASAAIKQAEAEFLPIQRQLEALARLGGKGMVPTGEVEPIYEEQAVQAIGPGGQPIMQFNPATQEYEPLMQMQQVKVGERPVMREVDFTGLGDADIAAKLADQMAQIQVDLSEKYGVQFVQEAKRQLELSDPEGTAARHTLHDLVYQDLDAEPERPVATTLEQQMIEALQRGEGLDAGSQGNIAATLAGRGHDAPVNQAQIEQALTTGSAGEQRRLEAMQKALGFETSGATPLDVAYRREQQGLANLSSFLQGTTPTAQFGQLSGAQRGPTPVVQGPPLPGLNPAAGPAAASAAAQNYSAQLQALSNQADDWFSGIGLALQGAGTLGLANQQNN